MLTGAVWLFIGWRKRTLWVQPTFSTPCGVGLFIVGPLLLITLAWVASWFVAAGAAPSFPRRPPKLPCFTPNYPGGRAFKQARSCSF